MMTIAMEIAVAVYAVVGLVVYCRVVAVRYEQQLTKAIQQLRDHLVWGANKRSLHQARDTAVREALGFHFMLPLVCLAFWPLVAIWWLWFFRAPTNVQ